MYSPSVGITPEGWPAIGLSAFSSLIFALIGCPPLAAFFLVLVWFSCHFFRDPERVPPEEINLAVSPADGRVVRIETREDPLTGDRRTCVSIFMNVFSVHVNRAPVDADVERIVHYPGKFLNAAWDKASTDNERCSYLLRDREGLPWTMVQIAGFVARRIVCRVERGDALRRGQRYGMIRFGSRVDLYLPEEYTACVSIGERVFAGQTAVARRQA